MLSSANALENNRFAEHYSNTFDALGDPWGNSATNPFIDNPTAYGDFSDGHPGMLLIALSLIEAMVNQIDNDLRDSAK